MVDTGFFTIMQFHRNIFDYFFPFSAGAGAAAAAGAAPGAGVVVAASSCFNCLVNTTDAIGILGEFMIS